MKRERWAVVGGGMLGMTLALRLAEQGKAVTLIEGAQELGGLAAAWNLGNIVWDKHYHVTLLSDLATRGILSELGLERNMRWVETKSGFYADGTLSPLSSSLDYLRLPALRLDEKVRLALNILYASRLTDWKALEQVPATEWLAKWSGASTVRKLWVPLLRAKLGENYSEASAAFIWAIIQRLYSARKTGLKREMFGYVPGGYSRILARFEKYLGEKGVTVRLGMPLQSAHSSQDSAVRLEFSDTTLIFDRVVMTTACPQTAKLVPELTEDELGKLGSIRYQGIVCASLLLKKPLAGNYLTYITDSQIPFTAVIEMSALVDPAHFAGRSLVYLPLYLPSDSPRFFDHDSVFRQSFLEGLKRMYPEIGDADVECFQVSRVRNVLPISTVGYSANVPNFVTSIPNLYVVNSSQILNGTLNVNETIQLAERAANFLSAAPQARPDSVLGAEHGYRQAAL